jgi:hypothetical protein
MTQPQQEITMDIDENIVPDYNRVNINYKYSETTDYYRSRNYDVAVIRIPDRYDVLIKIYKNLKFFNDNILSTIPDRKAYLNIDERELDFKIDSEVAWNASKYLESFIYSLAICKNKLISDYSGLITQYYSYVNYFLSNDCIKEKNKRKSIYKKLKIFNIDVEYNLISNIVHPYLSHIDYIQSTSKYDDGYNPLKSNFELSEHKLILLETLVYSKFEPTRMKLYEKFNIKNYEIQELNKYVEYFNYKNKETFEIDDENLKNGFTCTCCLTNYADCLYIGCNHLVLCSECYNSKNIKYEQKKKCPLCKTYSHVIQIKSG